MATSTSSGSSESEAAVKVRAFLGRSALDATGAAAATLFPEVARPGAPSSPRCTLLGGEATMDEPRLDSSVGIPGGEKPRCALSAMAAGNAGSRMLRARFRSARIRLITC